VEHGGGGGGGGGGGDGGGRGLEMKMKMGFSLGLAQNQIQFRGGNKDGLSLFLLFCCIFQNGWMLLQVNFD
jgi:hypothetical protein